jgi:hypothetical protein
MTQLPAAAPRVTYQNGRLAIAAQNSTLSEILRDVRKLTGASVDMPQSAGSERVVAQVGPGAPRDVLALLLNGTSFNYVMLGSASDPATVASIVLSLKPSSGAGEVQSAAVSNNGGFQQNQPMIPGRMPPQVFRQQPPGMIQPGATPQPGAEEENTEDTDNAEEKEDDSEQQQVQPVQPGIVQPEVTGPDQQVVDPNQPPNGGPKTPEQLLQMMRQAQPPGSPNTGLPAPPNLQPPHEE